MTAEKTPLEAWVSQVAGRVSIAIEDVTTGKKRTVTIKGKGAVLRVNPMDRRLLEEKVQDESLNPFRNGTLALEKGNDVVTSPQSMSDDELAALFELDDSDFKEALPGLTEVNVRRLKDLSVQRNASYNHVGAVKDYIEEAYPIGGDNQAYRDIMAEDAAARR